MSDRFWAAVPAAGVGKRMASVVPKQYLPLLGRPLIEQTLSRLLAHPKISGVFVALSEGDGWWSSTSFADDPRVVRVGGGEERCHSVLNVLQAMGKQTAETDWVLVHDAARPCVHREDLDNLMDQLDDDPVGGLLGVPLHDTVKSVETGKRVVATIPREPLWRAFTPQMFRLGMLRQALSDALDSGKLVTDDASAMELAGFQPRMVEGRIDNIKVTCPEDLALAAFFLDRQSSSGE
ncbi:MAG: 2-C-methyl-D-erythritol 4-phosphate cytidylyltransferase [Gammaproteobacteria bacterium (ex Lamellibrachia satsuma)]|nr:MAG: 2-C-methyl-D-erythritol 4-phosphate cytidylyltransferase [Gammaproteobacteria bacterium (ex Lamellibrachia satsuma)]RRS33498.1 MAG: 2-C-methyl-D-erythritol 4-phosphate cytidylyltransferase [Gammaproteobacteria bacterium (ex Lamellibrachia satsuma)]RRS34216.1 MAG: 2-C-methyl-D-erythritol 4-phosphate cytidylyltransferase [Gammaproteobacteria bacterium (ex Lamellibrachia satsuma)]